MQKNTQDDLSIVISPAPTIHRVGYRLLYKVGWKGYSTQEDCYLAGEDIDENKILKYRKKIRADVLEQKFKIILVLIDSS